MSDIKPCCKVNENLEIQESGKSDLSLKVCKICGSRHFELTIDPASIGIKMV